MTDSLMQRIRRCIENSGPIDLPRDESSSLRESGFDSLKLVLTVSELEREFGIRIPASKIDEEQLDTLAGFQNFLISLGVPNS